MLKKIAQRLAFGGESWDPVAYWRKRASDPASQSVMWANLAYNELVDRDEWEVIRRFFPEKRGSCLDLGCGTGRMTERLASTFDAYTGVDLDTMVEEAARRNPGRADRFVAATVDAYAYPDEAFDFVLSLGCVATACTADGLRSLAPRLARAVRPGGRLLFIEPFHESRLLTRGCKVTARDVVHLFEGLGFSCDAEDGILFFPARMVLSEPVFARLPRVTQIAYEAGERAVRLRPSLFADYALIALAKRG
jgi:SAM-dependent methyltransferase